MGGLQAVSTWEPERPVGADEESAWAKLAASGDAAAFEKLYHMHRDRIYALCWRLCGGDAALAQDVLQESFIRAWNKLHLFRGESRFGTWLHRVTVNVALSDRRIRLRKVKHETPMDETVERTAVGAADVSQGLRNDLEQAIQGLPERARTVLILFDVEGYRHQEIAEMTGMAVGSSKAQLHRARKLVREALNE
jgi:RNA polymerase sigma factor (sigma-70 family)